MRLLQPGKWLKTRSGHAVIGAIELALAYLFVSLAISSGSLWQWALGAVLLFSGIVNLTRSLMVHTK